MPRYLTSENQRILNMPKLEDLLDQNMMDVLLEVSGDKSIQRYLRKSGQTLRIYDEEVSGGRGRSLLLGPRGYREDRFNDKYQLKAESRPVTVRDIVKNFETLNPENLKEGLNNSLKEAFGHGINILKLKYALG